MGASLKCRICGRPVAAAEYCEVHALALRRIRDKYVVWKRALDVSWKQYLNEIVNNPLTGIWAREVAEDIAGRSNENVEES